MAEIEREIGDILVQRSDVKEPTRLPGVLQRGEDGRLEISMPVQTAVANILKHARMKGIQCSVLFEFGGHAYQRDGYEVERSFSP